MPVEDMRDPNFGGEGLENETCTSSNDRIRSDKVELVPICILRVFQNDGEYGTAWSDNPLIVLGDNFLSAKRKTKKSAS